MDHRKPTPRPILRPRWPRDLSQSRAALPSRLHAHPDRPPLGRDGTDESAHARAWAAHVAAGRIGPGPPPRMTAPSGTDYGLASLEAIVRGVRS